MLRRKTGSIQIHPNLVAYKKLRLQCVIMPGTGFSIRGGSGRKASGLAFPAKIAFHAAYAHANTMGAGQCNFP
jgi:hypothetical protein